MSYKETLDYMFGLQKFGIKFGLSSTENLLSSLGNPHHSLPCLHLAGTNGKGSVGATLCAVLRRAGYKVGFYTSPHLITFRERFKIGPNLISAAEVVDLADRVKAVCAPQEPPTFFEFVTAMAFLYFAENKVDLAILETGMGGRLDATNVARPHVGIITNISIEHTDYLGRTLPEIAYEKAGIIKPDLTVITGEKKKQVLDVFEKTAQKNRARLLALGRDFSITPHDDGGFDYNGLEINIKGLKSRLLGRHQMVNSSLALAALEALEPKGFAITRDHIRQGLLEIEWPGRAEIVSNQSGGPQIMLDGAHNPAAAKVLAKLLKDMDYRHLHLVLGIMADKDIAGIMAPLAPLAQNIYLTRPDYFRAANPAVLKDLLKDYPGNLGQYTDIPSAIGAAKNQAEAGDLVLITGSLFTVGEARSFLTGQKEDL